MNREIEFRGVSKSTGNFVYGTLINYRDKEYYILTDDEINYGLDFDFLDCCEVIQVYPESVGQYTGLKDKNGVKIFEGDIVKQTYIYENNFEFFTKEIILVVKYEKEWCQFILDHSKDPDGNWDSFCEVDLEELEVIDNIYENPKLLEVQDE